MRLESQKSAISLRNMQSQERQNESLITLTSHEDTPVTSRKESKNDLKKYIKMVAYLLCIQFILKNLNNELRL